MTINKLQFRLARYCAPVFSLGLLLFIASCGDDDGGGDDGPSGDVGTITVTVTTAGVEMDTDGFTVSLSTGESMSVNNNGSVTFENVAAGALVDVTLEGARVNCDPDEGFEQSVFLSQGGTENITYTVDCTSKPLVFSSNREGEYNLYRMNLDGSGVRMVAEEADGPRWSPDGTKIAYWAFDDAIYIMNADGTGVTQLVEGADSPASWSPDGTRLALEINNQIHIINSDGTGQTQITDLPGSVFYAEWGPAADPRLLFSYDSDIEEDIGLWVVDADGGNLTQLTNDYDDLAAWSNDGNRISFSRLNIDNGTYVIYTMSMAGGDPERRTGTGAYEIGARWSPDDTQLTFVTVLTDILGNDNAEVCIGSSTEPGAFNLTQSLADDYDSDWRPDQ